MLLAGAFAASACGGATTGASSDDSTPTDSTLADTGLRGTTAEPPRQVGQLALPDGAQDGADFSFQADEGELLLVYFGYTHCPDMCPLTMSDVAVVEEELLTPEEAERVELAMVTIDPARDRPDLLAEYVQSWAPDGHALATDDPEALQTAAVGFGVMYEVEGSGDTTEVGHSASLYAVDDTGSVVVQWSFGTPAEDIAHDLQLLLNDQEVTPA